MWKVRKYEFVFNTIHLAITCALHIQEILQSSKSHVKLLSRGKMSISAGNITFSVIGDERARHFIVGGAPLIEARKAKKVCIPGDLVLASSAWDHCTPCNYEYVIKDSCNVKIASVIEHPMRHRERIRDPHVQPSIMNNSDVSFESRRQTDILESRVTSNESGKLSDNLNITKRFSSVEEHDIGYEIFTGRISVAEATRRKLGIHLRTFMLKPVLQQIAKDEPLENLSELRRVTVVSINMIPEKCAIFELITLLDECFMTLNRIIPNDMGCKVTLLDKDVLFLIVFGLRGYETQYHCKNGITSAMKMLKALKSIPGVKTVSIGVTTGMVFCGVIGHAVRKQYAILGGAVEKAPKIMFGYSDKVICEFDTILHSKLPKSKFISQGIKELKGYGSCHIYQFIDDPLKSEIMEHTGNLQYDYPILGRFQELELFLDVLDDIGVINRLYYGILIRGKSRTGKSRILDAYAAIIRSRRLMSINLSLQAIYEQKPLSVIYRILVNIVGVTDCDTIQERERVLIRKLAPIVPENSLCYLNTLLRVNFQLSDEYCADNDWSRHVKTMEIFDSILGKFNERKCILLDNVQFLDRMSWQYICRALTNDNIVLAMTILESDSGISQVSSDIIGHPKLFKCSLSEWDSKQNVAFACQLMNVRAIPKKLEKDLKNHNDKTPGWCEAYVTLVLQNKALNFLHLSSAEARQKLLTFPPVSLINKKPKDFLPEEVIVSSPLTDKGRVFVCLLNRKYNDVPRNLSKADDIMIKVYTNLNPYEQELLKCAATLGYVFTRNMLQSVMFNYTVQHTNSAIAELIRIQILECASIQRPNISGGDPYCYFEDRLTFSDSHHLLLCACHPTFNESEENVPNYARCKLLEFKVHAFREILLQQILPHQFLEFHTKAVKFYEKYARKCSGCGSGTFCKTPGKQQKLKVAIEKMSPKISLGRTQSASTNSNVERKRYQKRSFFSVGGTEFLDMEHDLRKISILPTVLDQEPDDFSAMSTEYSSVTYVKRRKNRNSWKICCFTRNKRLVYPSATGTDPSLNSQLKLFGSVDFRNCQCNYIINCIYWKLLYHAKHLGEAYVMLGKFLEAKESYLQALNLRSIKFPMEQPLLCFNSLHENWKLWLQRECSDYPNYRRLHSDKAATICQTCSLLRSLSNLYRREENWKLANLAALQSLNKSFEYSTSFIDTCESYLTAVTTYRELGDLNMSKKLERIILKIMKTKGWWTNVEEIVKTAEVYMSIFYNRILRGELRLSLIVGFKVLRIAAALHLSRMKLSIIPLLVQIMIKTKRVHEAVDLMQLLSFLAEEDIDKTAFTWYYALCLDFILDVGIIIETYEDCSSFAQKLLKESNSGCYTARDPDSLKRLLTGLWSWQLRMGKLVIDDIVYYPESYLKDMKHHNFSRILTVCKVLECYLIVVTRCINMKKAAILMELRTGINLLIRQLNGISKVSSFVKPRLYLLKSYLAAIRGCDTTVRIYLSKGKKYALLQENQMMTAWIKQNTLTWQHRRDVLSQVWVEQVGFGKTFDSHQIYNFNIGDWSAILYQLPIPEKHF
ncbi:adenylate cyclase type 10 [Cephus cinctus]|uniref:Adenylate cyclase type 10 n=1 Tax=Cephus cinctus TaxID=211228 RepID=A0AAJ7BVA0_CEPCN|nr:adenylate cyclase type 10 [Cephus cinctus]